MDTEIKEMEVKSYRYIVKYTVLTDTDTSQEIPIPGPPPNTYLVDFAAKVNTAFAGPTHPTVKVGYTGSLDALMRKQGISSAKYLKSGGHYKVFCHAMNTMTGEQPIRATFETASGNLSTCTAGEIEFVVTYLKRK